MNGVLLTNRGMVCLYPHWCCLVDLVWTKCWWWIRSGKAIWQLAAMLWPERGGDTHIKSALANVYSNQYTTQSVIICFSPLNSLHWWSKVPIKMMKNALNNTLAIWLHEEYIWLFFDNDAQVPGVFVYWSASPPHCVLGSWRRYQDHVSEASGSTLTRAWWHVSAGREERRQEEMRGEERRERLSSLYAIYQLSETQGGDCSKKQKHDVTSHLYHNPTGSITLQSPPPSPDNTSSIPWQPLIDLSLERAAGGGEIGKDWEIGSEVDGVGVVIRQRR